MGRPLFNINTMSGIRIYISMSTDDLRLRDSMLTRNSHHHQMSMKCPLDSARVACRWADRRIPKRVSLVIGILHTIVPHTGPVRTSRDLVVHVPTKSFAFAKVAVINRLQIKNILVDKGKNRQKGSIWRTPFIGVGTNNIVQQGPGMGRVDGDIRSNQLTNTNFKCTL